MNNRRYELTFILPPTLAEEDLNATLQTIQGWITDRSGEIVKVNHWGRRKLAYPVQNYKEGYYVLIEFQNDAATMKELDRRLRLEAGVLRYLLVHAEE